VQIYVPIVRGMLQKKVWTFAKALAHTLAARNPELLTAEYRIAKRPARRVLVDYNQNAWGRTLSVVRRTVDAHPSGRESREEAGGRASGNADRF
jgi:bifunctional non-homologous end joining protein LigD